MYKKTNKPTIALLITVLTIEEIDNEGSAIDFQKLLKKPWVYILKIDLPILNIYYIYKHIYIYIYIYIYKYILNIYVCIYIY